MVADNRIYFGKGDNVPRIKRFLSDVKDGVVAMTFWSHQEVGHNQDAKKEIKALFDKDVFGTPKPERLIERVLTLGSNPGDLVLDSFLGSGTTAAVAHKMGRRWIGVELGDHAYTHCEKRMRMVVDGNDQGGISKAVGWRGGGGFKFYELAPSLLNVDKYGNLVINREYNADMLAAAMAKQMGYTYQPDAEVYWKQGRSSEHDYIFTTTQFLTVEALAQLHDAMGEEETLKVCCTAFQPECRGRFDNITVEKIPQILLNRCEFARDDYSLNIVSLPALDREEEADAIIEEQEPTDNMPIPGDISEPSLFD